MQSFARRIILAFALIAGIYPSFAAAPPPVPALPDSERRTSYSISGTTCICAVNFSLYGDSTDYQNWVEVFINGTRVNYNDTTFGWTITSPTGALANIPRPVTDAVLTFTNAQTGAIQIVGARRPRRVSQFSETTGVPARNLNQVFNDITAMAREVWDKINDVTGRGIFGQPGDTFRPLPNAATRASTVVGFDALGNVTTFSPSSGVTSAGNVTYLPPGTGGIATTVQAELNRTVYVADYAVCDHVTVNTTQIQLAYNAANGGNLVFPSNSFCLSDRTLNANLSGTHMLGDNSFLGITTAAPNAIEVNAVSQVIQDLTVFSTLPAASRTGAGIKDGSTTSNGGNLSLVRVNSQGHFYGLQVVYGPNLHIDNSFFPNNFSNGIYMDAYTGGTNLGAYNESKIINSTATGNGGYALYMQGGHFAGAVSLIHFASGQNALGGIKANSPDGTTANAVSDLWISQPELSGNGATSGDVGIDLSTNTGAITINIDGSGLIEFFQTGISVGAMSGVQIGNVPIIQSGTALLLNGLGGSVAGTFFGGNTINVEMGASSSGYTLSGLNGNSAIYGTTGTGLKIDVGAGSFSCTGVDFTSATTPLSGSVPANSALSACPTKSHYVIQPGSFGQVAVYAGSTNQIGGDGLASVSGGNLSLGLASFGAGSITLNRNAAGSLTFAAGGSSGTNTLTFPAATTDFSATGGTSQVIKQPTSGGAFTVGQLSCSDLSGVGTGCSAASGITALTGDGTATGPGSAALTLATVNANVGSFGSTTQCVSFTTNGKGLITAASAATCAPAVGSIAGLGTGVATFLATPSGANLASALTTALPITKGGTGTTTGAFVKVNIQTLTSSGTYTPSTGLLYAEFECPGGGGGGGGVAGNVTYDLGAGGGGSGSYSKTIATAATIGASQTVTIGAAGAGGASGANNGSAGGDTSVGTLCIGKGGSGGGGISSAAAASGGLGGVAGTGTVTGTGAPGGAGFFGYGTVTVLPQSGVGGSLSPFGGGGLAVTPSGPGAVIAGNNASGHSTGGSGAAAALVASNAAGGNGSAGIVVVTEYLNQ